MRKRLLVLFLSALSMSGAVTSDQRVQADSAGAVPAATANSWVPLGPDSGLLPSLDATFGTPADRSGRVTSVAIDGTNSKIVYAGGELGGVWKTNDGGASWMPLTDFQPSLAIGSMAIDPTNSQTVYVATGASDSSGYNYFGAGILKTNDGGTTFVQLGVETFTGLSISKLVIDPTNSQVVYAATAMGFAGGNAHVPPPIRASFGIYKSVDGAATWVRLTGAPGGPVRDLKMDPVNRSVLYATLDFSAGLAGTSGIYRTVDGGTTWTLLGGDGFPTTGFGRISLAIAPSNPRILYTALTTTAFGADLLSILKSVDGGASWAPTTRPVSGYGSTTLCTCDFVNAMAVSPGDPNIVFWGGASLYRSTDGGLSWVDATRESQRTSSTGGMQGDLHAVEFDPSNPNRVVVGSDGGVFASLDAGNSWLSGLNSNLSLTQFYRIAIHPTDDDYVLGGAQDKGAILRSTAAGWNYVSFGDGGDMQIDFDHPSTLYHPDIFMSFERSDDGGRTWQTKESGLVKNDRSPFQIIMPVTIDPSNSSTLYLGSYRLYETTNRGDNWSPVSGDLTNGGGNDAIATIAVAKSSPSTIYVGTSDGNVQVTTNGGSTFRNSRSGLPFRFISRIAVDPANAQIAYLSVSGFGTGHVFKTTSGGSTWTDISGNLPDVPANALVIDSSVPKNIYIGSDSGVFSVADGETIWKRVGSNSLPNSPVFDLKLNNNTGSLFAATFGRGVFRLTDPTLPVITSVVNGASFLPVALAPNTWFSVFGRNLGTLEAAAAGTAGTLGGASITACGIPVPLNYNTGQGQVNALMPAAVSGKTTCPIVATVGGRTSAAFTTSVAAESLGIFLFSRGGSLLPVATHADYSVIGPPSADLFPATSGETIVLWCTGWNEGAGNPAISIGSEAARVVYYGPSGSSPGLCQINLVLGTGLASGPNELNVGSLPSYPLWVK